MTLTYVYCLVRSRKTPAMNAVPAPMPGAKPVRALPAGDGAWAHRLTCRPRDYDEAALAAGLQNLDWVGRRAWRTRPSSNTFSTAPAVLPHAAVHAVHVGRARARARRAAIAGGSIAS